MRTDNFRVKIQEVPFFEIEREALDVMQSAVSLPLMAGCRITPVLVFWT
jgi:hypothetical protein